MDIDLYSVGSDRYFELQELRPDYHGAISAAIRLAQAYSKEFDKIRLADFCGGTGRSASMFAREAGGLEKVNIIDPNAKFLQIARQANIHTKDLETMECDILLAPLNQEYNVVFALFSYHHVPDNKKHVFVEQINRALVSGGIAILVEIYLPEPIMVEKYYEKLKGVLARGVPNPELEKFIDDTAKSTVFEFKVSKSFANKQFETSGLELIASEKIWPTDHEFPEAVGTFVEVYKKS